MNYSLQKIDFREALEIVSWEYPAPYDIYNLHDSPLAIVKLVDGPYFSVFDEEQLIGFFCYGPVARLKTKRDHTLYHAKDYLDVGLGMHPDFCGRGLGEKFLRSGLAYARTQSWLGGFRLTVASNNPRAKKVYTRVGFQEIGRIGWDSILIDYFVVLISDSFEPNSLIFQVD